MQNLFQYLSYVIGDEEAELAVLAISSEHPEHIVTSDQLRGKEGEEEDLMMEEAEFVDEEGEI